MPDFSSYIQVDGKNIVLDPKQLRLECEQAGIDTRRFAGIANSFYLPRGRYPGRGYLLMLRKDFLSLNPLIPHTIRFNAPPDRTEIKNLYIVSFYSLAGGPVETATDAYLVEFADARVTAHLSHVNKNYNVVSPDHTNAYLLSKKEDEEDEEAPRTNWTWTQMVDDLYGYLPLTFAGTDYTVSQTPTTIPETYAFHGVPAWDAMCDIFDDANNIYYCDVNGYLVVKKGNDADTANSIQLTRSFSRLHHHAHTKHNTITFIPETVGVLFPRRDFAFQTSEDLLEVTFNSYWRNRPYYEIELSTSDVVIPGYQGIAEAERADTQLGTKVTLHNHTTAFYNVLGTLTNQAELQAEAEAAVIRYIQSLIQCDGYGHQIYQGAITFRPGTTVECVAWYDLGDGIFTEVHLSPRKKWRDRIIGGGSGVNAPHSNLVHLRDFLQLSVSEKNAPPDIARDHYPYEHWAVGKVNEASGIGAYQSGQVLVRYFDGTDWQNTGGSETAATSKTITAFDFQGYNYNDGDFVFCVYHGQARQWFIITPPFLDFVRFQLAEPLALSGSATANILVDTGGADYEIGPEITVKDWTKEPGSWSGKTGYRGWAVLKGDTKGAAQDPAEAEYEIIWMETQARYIEFTLNEQLSGPSAEVTVDAWWNIKEPEGAEGGPVEVHDRLQQWTQAPEGARGFAIWDEKEDQYVIVFCEHYAEGIAFTAYEDWKEFPDSIEVTVDDYWRGLDPTDPATGHALVIDYHGLFKHFRTDAKGIATYNKEMNIYLITECQSKAGWIWVTLSEDMSGDPASAQATVEGYKGTQQDVQNPGSIVLRGIPGISDGLKSGTVTMALYSSEDDVYFALAPPQTPMWARTQENWRAGDFPWVSCKLLTDGMTGTTVTGSAFNVYLPRLGGGDPNVVSGVNLLFMYGSDGVAVCICDYMDLKIGTVIFNTRSQSDDAIPGWGKMDGTLNHADEGGSGYDIRGRFPLAVGTFVHPDESGNDATYTLGQLGGENPHNHLMACLQSFTTDGTITNLNSPGEFLAWSSTVTGPETAQFGPTGALRVHGAGDSYTMNQMPAFLALQAWERLSNNETS